MEKFNIVMGNECPTLPQVCKAILSYCFEHGYTCDFIKGDEVSVDGVMYEVFCGASDAHNGRFVVECKKM